MHTIKINLNIQRNVQLTQLSLVYFYAGIMFFAFVLVGVLSYKIKKLQSNFILEKKEYEFSLNRTLAQVQDQKIRAEEQARDYINLLRVVLHDISVPLSVILGVLDLYKVGKIQFGPSHIEKMDRAGETLRSILAHVREVQSIRSGKKQFTLRAVSLSSAIQRTKENIQELLDKKEMTLLIESMTDLEQLHVLGDETGLVHQILTNLLTNSIKFSFHGGQILMQLKTRGLWVEISIRDFGLGMNQEQVNNVFRMDKHTSRRGTAGELGTGFGMPIVKSYVEAYGGKLILSSIPFEDAIQGDHGTSVSIFLRSAQSTMGVIEPVLESMTNHLPKG